MTPSTAVLLQLAGRLLISSICSAVTVEPDKPLLVLVDDDSPSLVGVPGAAVSGGPGAPAVWPSHAVGVTSITAAEGGIGCHGGGAGAGPDLTAAAPPPSTVIARPVGVAAVRAAWPAASATAAAKTAVCPEAASSCAIVTAVGSWPNPVGGTAGAAALAAAAAAAAASPSAWRLATSFCHLIPASAVAASSSSSSMSCPTSSILTVVVVVKAGGGGIAASASSHWGHAGIACSLRKE